MSHPKPPSRIILDVQHLLDKLAAEAGALGLDVDVFCKDTLGRVLEYLCEEESSYGNLEEYGQDVKEAMIDSGVDDDLAQTTARVTVDFGLELQAYLKQHGVYDHQGYLWYEYGGHLGRDLMLNRIGRVDFIN